MAQTVVSGLAPDSKQTRRARKMARSRPAPWPRSPTRVLLPLVPRMTMQTTSRPCGMRGSLCVTRRTSTRPGNGGLEGERAKLVTPRPHARDAHAHTRTGGVLRGVPAASPPRVEFGEPGALTAPRLPVNKLTRTCGVVCFKHQCQVDSAKFVPGSTPLRCGRSSFQWCGASRCAFFCRDSPGRL